MSNPPLHLSKVDLTAFRGIEGTLSLEFGRRLTIIYGGNATGKSSIAQAIEFAISGQVRNYEDGLISAEYLANTRAAAPGWASLTLDDGAVLTGATNQARSDIVHRFRDIGSVDWPERQPLPLTTTHVTTQGMLARVLGGANAVTRNDLSGLCAGAYLRFLVARAQRLAEHFRQGSSGRNIQSELRDARAAYDTAKLLRDSLLTTNQAGDISSGAIDLKLRELNAKLNLPEPTSIDMAVSHLEEQLQIAEHRLRTLQGLLSRTRELGQYEAESAELTSQLKAAKAAQQVLSEKQVAANDALIKNADQLKQSANRRGQLLDAMAAYERHLQSVSSIAAFEERIRELRVNEQRTKEDIQALKQQLDIARSDFVNRSTKLAQLRQSRQLAELQRNAIQQVLLGISALPTDRDHELEATVNVLRREVTDLERLIEETSGDLDNARQEEELVAARLAEVSESWERFLAASNEIRAFVTDSLCPLCGHDHGSVETLERAIEHRAEAALEGAGLLRRQFETISQRRQASERRQLELAGLVAEARTKLSRLLAAAERKTQDRKVAVADIERSLTLAGLPVVLEAEVLRRMQADVGAKIAGFDQEIRDDSAAERDEETRNAQLERALAAKSSEGEQQNRLAAELNDQITKVRTTLGAGTTGQEIAKHKADLVEIELLVKTLEKEQGQTQATLLELDRTNNDRAAEIAGIERRLQVVDAFLDSLDKELKAVGASRDVRTILEIEKQTRHQLDDIVLYKSKAQEIKQDQRTLDQGRAFTKAQEQLTATEQSLKSVQNKQQKLQERGVQFKNLYESLETLQNDTAEIVLDNIRKPVSIIFRAMTAGCPWDLEFRLDDGKINALLTDGSARNIAATSVLNSAYVNVAAIALRLALASQQRWTRLRTVVLDDPILEMDNLTQSALIDGLEAVLSSTVAPWQDLQFVLTTWSEDFAVMAAHKLAHLNHSNGQHAATTGVMVEDFVIHRLSSDLDGTIVSQRHVPRWKHIATAA